jgi:ribosomal protein S18 acetylase RimI-like enzyme
LAGRAALRGPSGQNRETGADTVVAVFVIEPHPFEHPLSVQLVAELQAEYLVRYGGPDETPIEPGEFDPPAGLFLVGLLDGDPVAIGGWRHVQPGLAEIKRMYVAERARGRGLARRMLAELESTLAGRGYEQVILMTATAQPEAIALYESSGYQSGEPYGRYANAPDALFYRKRINRE